jgi:hypothetical protein
MSQVRQLIVQIFDSAADAGHTLRSTEAGALNVDQLTTLVDHLADAERRLQELSVTWPDHLEPVRFKRIQTLVAQLHKLARDRLLESLPESEEVPIAAMSRLEPVPSTSRAIGKANKSRPRGSETQKTPSTEKPESVEEVPIIKAATRRPVQPAVQDDEDIIANAIAQSVELDGFIKRLRTDAQRPSRIPADMQDLFDQQAARLDRAANDVDAVLARRRADFPVGRLSTELRTGAARLRREGIQVYSAILMGRKPRETYLEWMNEHGQVAIVKDERGRIKTRQRKDYFQEYRILDKTHQNKALWVAHFHYDNLTDPDDQFTAAHLKFAEGYLQELPAKTRQELNTFDALDNALRRIGKPQVLDLFLKLEPQAPAGAENLKE